MHVQVEVLCAPHPREEIEGALQAAGRQLASQADSVLVQVLPESRIAILEFEMRRVAQYKVVDEIYATVKHWAYLFYEDVTIRFRRAQ